MMMEASASIHGVLQHCPIQENWDSDVSISAPYFCSSNIVFSRQSSKQRLEKAMKKIQAECEVAYIWHSSPSWLSRSAWLSRQEQMPDKNHQVIWDNMVDWDSFRLLRWRIWVICQCWICHIDIDLGSRPVRVPHEPASGNQWDLATTSYLINCTV